MKVIEGHLTVANKKAIKAILKANKTSGRVSNIDYHINKDDEIYNVIIVKKDKGLIPCPGSLLRLSKYKAKFVL